MTAALTDLSRAEIQVLSLFADGNNERQAAAIRHVSYHTVHRQMENVRLKLHARTVAHAVHLAHNLGLLSEPLPPLVVKGDPTPDYPHATVGALYRRGEKAAAVALTGAYVDGLDAATCLDAARQALN